jgi:hypothetical protein
VSSRPRSSARNTAFAACSMRPCRPRPTR